ncbi:MAG: hypothetical protein IJB55_06560, partial [Firmicutes bacterium]|nr:hypothetical protein [Bacillota bacterium]
MSTNLITLPIILPMLTAIICMFLHGRDIRLQRAVAGIAAVSLLGVSLYTLSRVIGGDEILVFTAS